MVQGVAQRLSANKIGPFLLCIRQSPFYVEEVATAGQLLPWDTEQVQEGSLNVVAQDTGVELFKQKQ